MTKGKILTTSLESNSKHLPSSLSILRVCLRNRNRLYKIVVNPSWKSSLKLIVVVVEMSLATRIVKLSSTNHLKKKIGASSTAINKQLTAID